MALVFLGLTVAGTVAAQSPRDNYSLRDGELRRRYSAWHLRAVDIPDYIKPPFDADQFIIKSNRAANAGAQTIVFDLWGYSEDGSDIERDAIQKIRQAVDRMNDRRFAAVIRVVGEDWPAGPKARLALAETAGKLFHPMRCAIYYFEGDDSAELVKAFKKAEDRYITAARKGGDISFETDVPDPAEKNHHYLLPYGDEAIAAYEKASRLPVERKPWTPDNSVLSEQEREDGFIALFDGKTYNGWTITGDPSGWEIADGEVRFVHPGGGVILSRDRYADYILRLEFKISDGGNSGVFIRAPRIARQSRIGMESQIMGDHGREAHSHGTGAIYDVIAPKGNWVKPAGEWNTLEVKVDGDQFTNKINGKVAVDVNMNDVEKLRLRNRDGFIGLQDHSNPVAFRNIRIKPL